MCLARQAIVSLTAVLLLAPAAAEAQLVGTIKTPRVTGGRCLPVVFSPDGKQLAISVQSGGLPGAVLFGAGVRATGDNIKDGTQPPEEKTVRCASIGIWNVETGNREATLSAKAHVNTSVGAYRFLCFSADGAKLACIHDFNFEAVVWDATKGKVALALPTDNPFRALAISPDGSMLALVDSSGGIYRCDTKSGKVSDAFDGRGSRDDIVFSPDGSRVASGFGVWDVKTGRRVLRPGGRAPQVNRVAFNGDGKTLFGIYERSPGIHVWNLSTGRVSQPLQRVSGGINDVAASPTGSLIATAHTDGMVRVWDTNSRRLVKVFKGHKVEPRYVAFGPKGKLLASNDFQGDVHIWKVASDGNRAKRQGSPKE